MSVQGADRPPDLFINRIIFKLIKIIVNIYQLLKESLSLNGNAFIITTATLKDLEESKEFGLPEKESSLVKDLYYATRDAYEWINVYMFTVYHSKIVMYIGQIHNFQIISA